jgi:hypothetical protein
MAGNLWREIYGGKYLAFLSHLFPLSFLGPTPHSLFLSAVQEHSNERQYGNTISYQPLAIGLGAFASLFLSTRLASSESKHKRSNIDTSSI